MRGLSITSASGRTCILVLFAVLALAGCGTKREETQRREEQAKTTAVETTRTERSAIAPDGTPYVEAIVSTRTLEQTTRSEADTRIHGQVTIQAPELAAIGRAAVAIGGAATPWGAILGGLGGLGGVAFAVREAMAHSRTRKDSDEAWDDIKKRAAAKETA